MRSEIFNKIRQNKIQHYAELNKINNKVPAQDSSTVSEKDVKKPVPENKSSGKVKYEQPNVGFKNVQNSFETVLPHFQAGIEIMKRIELKPVIVNIFPKVKMILAAMVQTTIWIWKGINYGYIAFIHSAAMMYFRERVRSDSRKLKQMSVRMNDRIEQQSDKLARGIYMASSGLFEDKEENYTESAYVCSGFAESASGDNSMEWELEIKSQPKTTLNERLAALSEKTADRIKSIPNKINAFLASDKLPDLDGMTLSGMK